MAGTFNFDSQFNKFSRVAEFRKTHLFAFCHDFWDYFKISDL